MKRRNSLFQSLIAAIPLLAVSIAHAQEPARPSATDTQQRKQAINNALTVAAAVQHRVADYRQRNSRFPGNNQEALLGAPASFANADVQTVTVDSSGIVEIQMTASSGNDGGTILLTPTMSKNTDEKNVDWKCTSASFATIADDTNGVCEYSKLPPTQQ